jgi:peptidoglycan/LPS O-acetylase OafA/YrhL
VALLLLAHGVLTAWAHADLRTEARSAGAVALYSANWVVAGGGSLAAGLGHLWSLSVEGQFYLVLPAFLAVALVSRRPTALIVGVASAGILWATGLRAWLWMRGAGWETIYVRTDARVDELLMGVLLAVAFRHGWRLPHRWRYAGPAALALLLLFAGTVRRDSGWLYAGGGFTLVGLTAVLLVGATLDPAAGLATVFAWRPAVRLGRASYSLYLWHVPVFAAVTSRLAGRAASERLVVGLGGCALATLVSYRLVEMPLARVRRKLASERAPDRRESSRRQSPRQVLREQPVPSCRPTVPTTCLPLARSATPP